MASAFDNDFADCAVPDLFDQLGEDALCDSGVEGASISSITVIVCDEQTAESDAERGIRLEVGEIMIKAKASELPATNIIGGTINIDATGVTYAIDREGGRTASIVTLVCRRLEQFAETRPGFTARAATARGSGRGRT